MKPGRVLDQHELQRLAARVDDLATAERRPHRLQGADGVRLAEVPVEQHPGGRRGRGGVDHGREPALLQLQRADAALLAEQDLEGPLVAGLEQAVAGPRLGRGEVVVEADVGLLQLRQPVGDRGVDAEVAHLDAVGDPVAAPGDEGVVDVEHDALRGLLGQPGEQLGGGVDLGEPVELVPGDVEQQRVGGLDLRREPQGVRLIQLEDGHVGAQSATHPDLAEHRGDDPRVKLLPVGLVKTRRPCSRRIATSILVVVVLPLVPVTTTMPRGSPDSACARKPGSTRSTTSPGSADPPPRSLDATRAALPAATATVVLSTPTP